MMEEKKRDVDPSIKHGARRIRKIVWLHEAVQARGPIHMNLALNKSRFSTGFFDQAMEYALEQEMLYLASTFTPPFEPVISIHPLEGDDSPFQLKMEDIEQYDQ